MSDRIPIGTRVRFTDDHGRESVGIVRDDKYGRLAWRGRPVYLVQVLNPVRGERAWYWIEDIEPVEG